MKQQTCGVLALAGMVSSVALTWHLAPLAPPQRQADVARTTGNVRVLALVASSLLQGPGDERIDAPATPPQAPPQAEPARRKTAAAAAAKPVGVSGPLMLKVD